MIPEAVFQATLLSFFDPVRRYLDDPSVTEVMINGPGKIYIERKGKLQKVDDIFPNAKALYAALSSKNEADFTAKLADDVTYEGHLGSIKGKADAKKFFKEVTTGFPDVKHDIVNTITVGDYVISEGSMIGTHKGSFFGIPATKKSINVKSTTIIQFKDGKMVRGWAYSNGADFAQQLGLMPAPSAGKKADAKPGDAKAADPKAAPADAKAPAKK